MVSLVAMKADHVVRAGRSTLRQDVRVSFVHKRLNSVEFSRQNESLSFTCIEGRRNPAKFPKIESLLINKNILVTRTLASVASFMKNVLVLQDIWSHFKHDVTCLLDHKYLKIQMDSFFYFFKRGTFQQEN